MTSITQRQQLSLVILVITFFIIYLHLSTPIPYADIHEDVITTKSNQKIRGLIVHDNPTICDEVDISWLAADREYWDGWTDKIMFMRRDGTLTLNSVHMKEGEDVCVVALLGPTPAMSAIRNEDHIGPQDILSVTAVGEHSKLTIFMEQHKTQLNAYYSAVKFNTPDTYKLKAVDEYRSYFYEKPVLHIYRPVVITPANKIIVHSNRTSVKKKPTCAYDHINSFMLGRWVNASVFKETDPDEFYDMFERNENEFIEHGKVFVPDNCSLDYTTVAQGGYCLGKQTIHVWGDNNMKRNLLALMPGKKWCDVDSILKIKNKKKQKEMMRCVCHDTDITMNEYPWLQDANKPLTLTNSWDVDARIHYNNIPDSITQHHNLTYWMESRVGRLPHADTVIVGIGNNEISGIRVTPDEFKQSFQTFIHHLRTTLYPSQTIIIKTPQFFCCGTLKSTAWNSGRSLTFNMIMRDTIQSYNNILLWDIQSIGVDENTCLADGSSYSRRNVINIENQLLWKVLCHSSNR
ncbi:hypothetical protein BDB01DRAFT_850682 [Pilobolus umbonatus]|nr:hypothetical protein BDB01DRAFT_850682 [Pilobolus umbonatus]